MALAPSVVGGGDCEECVRLREQVRRLTLVAQDQAKALAELTDDVPPWAPSLAILYWQYGPTRWHSKSWVTECNRLKPLIRLLGDLPAAKLSPLVWAQHVSRRKLEPHYRGDAPADFLLNLELARAKQLLNWAVGNKMLKYNPLSSAKPLKTVSRRETWLPLPDVDRLLAACDDVVDKRRTEGDDDGLRAKALRAFVLLCHDSMLRAGEAYGLRRDRISPDGRVELASRTTKGQKRRAVFLTPRTLEAIRDMPPHALVFGDIGRKALARWFRQLCVVAGVDSLVAPGEKRVRLHDLRASGASTADENGARATAIRDTLGHAQLSTTEVYLRSAQSENARSAMEVMDVAVRRPALRAPHKKVNASRATKQNFVARKLER